jgi:AmmeMemoRadiSam system protein B/AmmeMemoRadiSam system protein A
MRRVKRLFLPFFFLFISFSAISSTGQTIRGPEVEGAFYPADPKALADTIDSYMVEPFTRPAATARPWVGLIVPHAGYQFSGRLAANAYRQLAGHEVTTFIILGPSHHQTYSGAALHSATMWQTPFGRLEVDTAVERALQAACPFVHTIDSAFTKEHSIEDQIPFIQKIMGRPKIVPIAMGAMQFGEEYKLATALSKLDGVADGHIVVIASSDMSHYLTQSQTLRRDSIAFTDVMRLDPDQLARDEASKATEFCGDMGVITLMLMAELRGAQPVFLGYSNSALSTGDTTKVVGYGAFGFFSPEPLATLDSVQRKELLRIARETVDTMVCFDKPAYLVVNDTVIRKPQGAFVTLTEKGKLRGCIGYMLPTEPLAKSVYDAAQQACAKDERFDRVKPEELKDIRVEISALSQLRRLRSLDDIKLGTTGLYLEKGDKHGVLLPQVATEFHWTKDDLLRELALKAGIRPQEIGDPDVRLYSFTAQVFSE